MFRFSLISFHLLLVGLSGISWAGSDVMIRGEGPADTFGWDVAGAGDVNGDGFRDLVVGAPTEDSVDDFAGRAYLFLGPLTGDLDADEADATFSPEAFGDNLGIRVAGGFDANGDGFDDLLLGARGNDANGIQSGRAYLFLGPLSGSHHVLSADAIISGEPFDELGHDVAAADLNDDGIDDLIVAAPLAPGSAAFAGQVHVFFGPVSGSLTTADADATILGRFGEEHLGTSIATGDIDGDQIEDLALGAPRFPLGETNPGLVYVFLGPLAGTINAGSADVILEGDSDNDNFGVALSAGDVNADGLHDLLIGADQLFATGEGRAHLFLGPILPVLGVTVPDALLIGEANDNLFGSAVAIVPDATGDGRDDLLIGAWNNASGGGRSGRAYFFNGPVSGTISATDADRFVTGVSGDGVGLSVAGLGDVNDDGVSDFAVGAPQFDESDPGYVRIVAGQAEPADAPMVNSDVPWLRVVNPAVAPVVFDCPAFAMSEITGLEIVDVRGRRVRSLGVVGTTTGSNVVWDGQRDDGGSATSGIYFVRSASRRDLVPLRFVLLN